MDGYGYNREAHCIQLLHQHQVRFCVDRGEFRAIIWMHGMETIGINAVRSLEYKCLSLCTSIMVKKKSISFELWVQPIHFIDEFSRPRCWNWKLSARHRTMFYVHHKPIKTHYCTLNVVLCGSFASKTNGHSVRRFSLVVMAFWRWTILLQNFGHLRIESTIMGPHFTIKTTNSDNKISIPVSKSMGLHFSFFIQ